MWVVRQRGSGALLVLMPALQSARRAARRVRGAARRAVSPEHGSSQCSKRTPRARTTRTTPCTWTPHSVSAAAPAPQTRSSFEATSAPCRKRAASSGERAASCGAPRRSTTRSSQSLCRVASATSGGLAASQVCSRCFLLLSYSTPSIYIHAEIGDTLPFSSRRSQCALRSMGLECFCSFCSSHTLKLTASLHLTRMVMSTTRPVRRTSVMEPFATATRLSRLRCRRVSRRSVTMPLPTATRSSRSRGCQV